MLDFFVVRKRIWLLREERQSEGEVAGVLIFITFKSQSCFEFVLTRTDFMS